MQNIITISTLTLLITTTATAEANECELGGTFFIELTSDNELLDAVIEVEDTYAEFTAQRALPLAEDVEGALFDVEINRIDEDLFISEHDSFDVELEVYSTNQYEDSIVYSGDWYACDMSTTSDNVQDEPKSNGVDRGANGFGSNGFGSNGFGSNGFGSNGFGSNGFGSNGFGSNGFGSNGFGSNGFGSNGFGANGVGSKGFGSNGFGSNGFGSNGFGSNGFGSNGLSSPTREQSSGATSFVQSSDDNIANLSSSLKGLVFSADLEVK